MAFNCSWDNDYKHCLWLKMFLYQPLLLLHTGLFSSLWRYWTLYLHIWHRALHLLLSLELSAFIQWATGFFFLFMSVFLKEDFLGTFLELYCLPANQKTNKKSLYHIVLACFLHSIYFYLKLCFYLAYLFILTFFSTETWAPTYHLTLTCVWQWMDISKEIYLFNHT